MLLIKKYTRIWKKNAWNAGLRRKGRERRTIFAQSIHELAQGAYQRRSESPQPRLSLSEVEDTQSIRYPTRLLSLIPSQNHISKRRSLPTDFDERHSEAAAFGASKNKRKRHESPADQVRNPIEHSDRHKKRSSIAVKHAHSRGPERVNRLVGDTRVNSPGVATPSQNAILEKARILISGKMDTTRTDYFRLKALGIDTGTPLVPRTVRKKSLAHVSHDKEKQRDSRLLLKHGDRSQDCAETQKTDDSYLIALPQHRDMTQEDDDSDEPLLAQMRGIRGMISDSISWFKTEGIKSRITSSSSGEKQALHETAKQKRLREFATTPSRTEQRLRRTRSHGLLPKGWDPRSRWRDEKGRISTLPASTWSGPSSTAASPPRESRAVPPVSNKAASHTETKKVKDMVRVKETAVEAAGSSVEDAIEL